MKVFKRAISTLLVQVVFVLIPAVYVENSEAVEIKVETRLDPPPEIGLKPLLSFARAFAPPRYYVSTFNANAYYADYYCRKSGRQLLSIEDDRKQNDIELYMEVNRVQGVPWISGKSIKNDGIWEWGTGEPIRYNKFLVTQQARDVDNCAMIAGIDQSDRKFQWIKENCAESYTFICES